MIAWCPVLNNSPESGLPWPAAPMEPLAAPLATRPQADMWLASSSKRLLVSLPWYALRLHAPSKVV